MEKRRGKWIDYFDLRDAFKFQVVLSAIAPGISLGNSLITSFMNG